MRLLSCIIVLLIFGSCSSSRKVKTNAGDMNRDSLSRAEKKAASEGMKLMRLADSIPFTTFSAKAKVEYEDNYGKQPETNAYIRMEKGKFIWISITATFLNIEAARVMIYPDSVVVVNRLEKTIEAHPLNFIRETISIPMTFDDLQKLIAGGVILSDGSVKDVFSADSFLLIDTNSGDINNELYFLLPDKLLARQVVKIEESLQNYSADILYDDYEKSGGNYFSVTRDITIPAYGQKIRLTFRDYEFNKELSVPFNRPESYTVK